MTGGAKAAGKAFVVATALALLVNPVCAQSKRGSHAAPQTENKPKVDEKAYKAALDRIPTPKKPYDPWGEVHSSEQSKPTNKPN